MNASPVPTFSARDIFDPKSFYNRLRSGFQPELKLRGLFYELQTLREAQGQFAEAAGSGRELVLVADDPVRSVDAHVTDDIYPAGQHKKLILAVQIVEEADWPPPKTRCRAFLLTAGMVERLCGAHAMKSHESRALLEELLKSEGKTVDGEMARVLSAAPEMSGEFGFNGRCRFPPFDLPVQASKVERKLPEIAIFLVVIDRHSGETNP